jgi:nucleoside-diphosphate-sugar epimerase
MSDAAPILVTGAAGNVGRACVAALRGAGLVVWALSRSGGEGELAVDLSLDFESGLARLAHRFKRAPSVIVHLAAAVPGDQRSPDIAATADITRAIDRHVHKAASAWGCRVIYSSGCSLYERSKPAFKLPSSPLAAGLSPYLEAKKQGEQLFQALDSTIFRLSGPVGPGIKRGVVMSRFVERCRADEPIEIWGSGLREQDFIHVDDIGQLIFAAVRDPARGIYNCASGRPVTMVELARETIRLHGKGRILFSGREDPLEGETARYSIEGTTTRFAWSPRIGLADMIRSISPLRDETIPCDLFTS